MPDPVESSTLAAADAAAEAAAKASPGSDLKPSLDPFRERSFDEIALKTIGETEGLEHRQKIEGEPDAAEPVVEETKAVEPVVEETKPVEEKPSAEAKPKSLIEDLLSESKVGEKPAEEKPAEDPYEQHKLRADASEKTKETFAKLKEIAREREASARKEFETTKSELESARRELEELKSKAGQPAEEIKKELEELRGFRAQFDTANDPQFRAKFDSRIEANYESIYTRLQAFGLPATEVEKLRALSTADRNEWIDSALQKVPSDTRRFIEAKLFDNVTAEDERQKALADARANADKVLAERSQADTKRTAQRDTEMANVIRPILPKLEFLHTKPVPPDASAESRKQIDAHNEFAAQMQKTLVQALTDETPQTRAEAALAAVLVHQFKRENARLTAELKEKSDKLAAITKASSISRASRTIASPSPVAPKAEPKTFADSSDAIDALFSEVTGSR